MSSLGGRYRHRVVARPRARARRARLAWAALAVALLGALAAVSGRRALTSAKAAWKAREAAAAAREVVTVEAPEPLRGLAQAAAEAAGGSADHRADAVKARLPCLSAVRVSRAWGRGRVTLTPVLRRGVALASRGGRPAGVLGEDGSVFPAPAGVYSLRGPAVGVDGAPREELRALAREWPTLSAPGAFPAPLAGLTYRGPDQGWQARLGDGTTVLWGRLDWTKEKLERLGEALADARERAPGAFDADLRWFEDGKVLLKPLGRARARGTL